MNPNVAIVSAVTAVVALIIAIFGASWLNQRRTKRLIEQLEKRFDAKIEADLVEIRRIDERLGSFDRRLDRIGRASLRPSLSRFCRPGRIRQACLPFKIHTLRLC
jgi:Flp pilus assembly protein TadB